MRRPSGTSAAYALLAQLGKTDPRIPRRRPRCSRAWRTRSRPRPANWASLAAYAALYGQTGEAKPEAALDSAAHVKAMAQALLTPTTTKSSSRSPSIPATT